MAGKSPRLPLPCALVAARMWGKQPQTCRFRPVHLVGREEDHPGLICRGERELHFVGVGCGGTELVPWGLQASLVGALGHKQQAKDKQAALKPNLMEILLGKKY